MAAEESVMYEQVVGKLRQMAETDYKKFNKNLLPGVEHILGVRVPAVRSLAKEIAREGDWQEYLKEADQAVRSPEVTYEEKMLFGFVIGYAKMLLVERQSWLNRFVPVIDSWGVCDSCCMGYQFLKKDQERWWLFLQPFLNSSSEFAIRFGVVALLDHFVNEDYLERIFSVLNQITHEGYYVKMAVAWAVSACLIYNPERTYTFLMTDTLDDFTHNKAIQKCRESYRVSEEMKTSLMKLKRTSVKGLQK